MARLFLALPRAIGVALALGALALAACGKSGTPSVSATPTPSPTPSNTSSPTGPTPGVNGVVYLPDGGNGGSFEGIQVVHLEDQLGVLLPFPQPFSVSFPGGAGPFALSNDATDAVTVLSASNAAPYFLLQDIFGSVNTSLVPVGSTYNLSLAPPLAPSATPSPVLSPLPVLNDAYSVSILGSSSSAVALTTGTGATGIVALTSLVNAPPEYGGFVPFYGPSIGTPPPYPRGNIAVSQDSTVVVVRGTNDLLSFGISLVATGYQFKVYAEDNTLGYGGTTLQRGHGIMAFDPDDSGRLMIGQTPLVNQITLVTTLPKTITHQSSITLPSPPLSIAVTANGEYAAVGTALGFFIIKGVNLSGLTLLPSYLASPTSLGANSPTYVACDGKTHYLQNITSIGFTTDTRFIVLLGSSPGVTCPNGYNSSIVALPFNQDTGTKPSPSPTSTVTAGPLATPTPTPQPTQFTQNEIITPPTGSDLMVTH